MEQLHDVNARENFHQLGSKVEGIRNDGFRCVLIDIRGQQSGGQSGCQFVERNIVAYVVKKDVRSGVERGRYKPPSGASPRKRASVKLTRLPVCGCCEVHTCCPPIR
jgi:hypothetical protein